MNKRTKKNLGRMRKQRFYHDEPIYRFDAYISSSTPTNCLLRDNKRFGAPFQEKIPPALCPGCKCNLSKIKISNLKDLEKSNLTEDIGTDLGVLDPDERKFYKNSLLANRQDLDDRNSTYFSESIKKIHVSDEFAEKVRQVLSND